MPEAFRRNHYVPEWYQRRFFLPEQAACEFYLLDLKPDRFVDTRGKIHESSSIKRCGPRRCFVEDDLYTAKLGTIESREIEKYFFGDIDRKGRVAVEYFTNFSHPSVNGEAYQSMMIYMSTQKLRTPKGLDWISKRIGTTRKNDLLREMLRLRSLYCAIWTECVWQIADASLSDTKFIISDHPVTVYNRICGPRSERCRGSNDPDIWLNGTHTIFPLSLEKVLIFTNLSWVRNPYQSEVSLRPNPNPFREAIFNFTEIQTLRHLAEQEVIDINYIIKRRAFRYIAAANKEWLFPERHVSTTKWNEFGKGYFFMPDPRPLCLGGEIIIGHQDGTASGYDEYGRRPWEPGYTNGDALGSEEMAFYRFQAEFARLFGPCRRGRSFSFMYLDNERDNEEFHRHHLELERKRHKK